MLVDEYKKSEFSLIGKCTLKFFYFLFIYLINLCRRKRSCLLPIVSCICGKRFRSYVVFIFYVKRNKVSSIFLNTYS